MGGFDGNTMVPSVEIYDPRLDSWMDGDSMNQSRGYSAAAVVNKSIYVIGGVEDGENVVGTVSCFFAIVSFMHNFYVGISILPDDFCF